MVLFSFIFIPKVNAESIETTINYGKSENYENYLSQSKNYTFSLDDIDVDDIVKNVYLLDQNIEEIRFEPVLNIFNQIQYILIEATNKEAYIIYDIMLNKIMEYNLTSYSVWTLKNKSNSVVKVYKGFGEYFFANKNNVIDIYSNKKVGEINEADYEIAFSGLSSEVQITDLSSYNNKLIRSEKIIDNGFYFENFNLPSGYNNGYSCAHVAASLLLGYYDTFYNGNIVPDTITYNGTTFKTTIRDSNSTIDISKWIDATGPTEDFHDYLYQIGLDYLGFPNDYGLTMSQTATLLNKYIDLNASSLSNVINAGSNVNFTSIILKDKLDNDIPVILGMCGYDYYYYLGPTLIGYSANTFSAHAVVAYGYQETSIGTFYKAHMGWYDIYGADLSEAYIDPTFVSSYAFLNYSGSPVDSYNYEFSYSGCSFLMSPSKEITDYFTYISSDANYDYYQCILFPSINASIDHDYSVLVSHNSSGHTLKCKYCSSERPPEPHNENYIGYEDEYVHYIECSICGYQRFENHVIDVNYEIIDAGHSYKCNICKEEVYLIPHTFVIEGTLEEHNYVCTGCGYQKSINDDHIVSIIPDSTGHTYQCSCGFELHEEHINNGEYEITESGHEYRCLICNELLTTAPHTYLMSGTIEDHYYLCSECGYETSIPGTHDYTVSYDITHHYYECSCGFNLNEEHHLYLNGWDDETHRYSCVCGYEIYHEHIPTDQYEIFSYGHSGCRNCYVIVPHNFVFNANAVNPIEEHWYQCIDCGYTTWIDDPHTYSIISYNSTGHTYHCSCGFEVTEAHNIINGNCSICGYGCVHSYTYSEYSSSYHLKSCIYCDYNTYVSHSFHYHYTPTQHYKECSYCGYTTTPVNHTFYTEPTGRTYCTVCWYESLVQPWSFDPIYFILIENDKNSLALIHKPKLDRKS